MIRPALAALTLMALAACQPDLPPQDLTEAPRQGYTPDQGGIAIDGTDLRIDFGRDEIGVIVAMTDLIGRAPDQQFDLNNCGTLFRWNSQIDMRFADGVFKAWNTRDFIGGEACRVQPAAPVDEVLPASDSAS